VKVDSTSPSVSLKRTRPVYRSEKDKKNKEELSRKEMKGATGLVEEVITTVKSYRLVSIVLTRLLATVVLNPRVPTTYLCTRLFTA
jgi:hypothetical protein